MLDTIIQSLGSSQSDATLKRAVIGLGYIAVELYDGRVGISANIAPPSQECSAFGKAGSLAGSPLSEILIQGKGADLLGKSLALAAVNALSISENNNPSGDVFDQLSLNKTDAIVMVGYIAPVVRMLESRGFAVAAFDLRKIQSVEPEEAMPAALEKADVVIITATTLINDTLERILDLAHHAREVVLMGPSTPMWPEIFRDSRISWLAGSRVVKPDRVFQIVMEGGGTPVMFQDGALEKVVRAVRPCSR